MYLPDKMYLFELKRENTDNKSYTKVQLPCASIKIWRPFIRHSDDDYTKIELIRADFTRMKVLPDETHCHSPGTIYELVSLDFKFWGEGDTIMNIYSPEDEISSYRVHAVYSSWQSSIGELTDGTIKMTVTRIPSSTSTKLTLTRNEL